MIKLFAAKLQDLLNTRKAAIGLTYFKSYRVDIQNGNKFAKVFRVEIGHDDKDATRHIVAFVDMATGDIFKPATYKAPAKHARGNINSDKNGMEAITSEGFVVYLRG
jgi:hypothetical protein